MDFRGLKLLLKNKISHDNQSISIDEKKINIIQENEISNIDWKKNKVDVVLECTGKFNSKDKSAQHIDSGAKKVLVSAPCKGADNIVFGVNHKNLNSKDKVISAASCTTNCLAPVVNVLNNNYQIEKGFDLRDWDRPINPEDFRLNPMFEGCWKDTGFREMEQDEPLEEGDRIFCWHNSFLLEDRL